MKIFRKKSEFSSDLGVNRIEEFLYGIYIICRENGGRSFFNCKIFVLKLF